MNLEQPKKSQTELIFKEYKQITDSLEFKSWFKDSVVIDNDGNPLLTYHSSTIKDFKGASLERNEAATNWNSYGIYFSSNRQITEAYFRESHEDKQKELDKYNSIPQEWRSKFDPKKINEITNYFNNNENVVKTFSCFLKIEHPLILNNHSELMNLHYSGTTRKSLMNDYDGIIIKHDSEFGDQYIVFSPDQIHMLPSILK
jgi:hypothetical protein